MSPRILRGLFLALLFTPLAATPRPCHLCLFGPDNMAFSRTGTVYLVDTDHHLHSRVLELTRSGNVLRSLPLFTPAATGHAGPEGIARGRNGNLWVTDAAGRQVLHVTPQGKMLGRLRAGFSDLGHIAIGAQGQIYVAEAAPNRIQVFAPDGHRLAVWQRTRGSGLQQWAGPECIAMLPNGNLAVEDWPNHRVQIVSPQGVTLREFPTDENAGIAADTAGNIYTADAARHRVRWYSPQGKLLGSLDDPGRQLFRQGPDSLAIGPDGNLYAADGLSVVKFTRAGRLLARWR